MIFGLLLIAGALALFCYNKYESDRAGEVSAAIREKLAEKIGDEEQDPYAGLPWDSGDWDSEGEEPLRAVPEMPVEEIDGYDYIGILEIPSAGISLPVMAEWDYTRLNLSPCLYSGSYYSDDMVICAHNFAVHFLPLLSMDIGVDVYFTAVGGTVCHYEVSNRETVEPTDVEKMIEAEDNWDLTLFTCNLDGQTRCAVRCERVED